MNGQPDKQTMWDAGKDEKKNRKKKQKKPGGFGRGMKMHRLHTVRVACVPVVRMMLLYGSCSVKDQPDVWQCVRNIKDFELLGLNFSFINSAHRRRAARSLAISM
jgi:hypothetical protein